MVEVQLPQEGGAGSDRERPAPLTQILGLLIAVAGTVILALAMGVGARWLGWIGARDAVTELVAGNSVVRGWLIAALATVGIAALLLLAAGAGLLKFRKWALKLAFFYSVVSLAALILTAIIFLSHFGNILKKPNGLTPLEFEVTLTHPSGTNVTVAFATVAGTATPGEDFIATNGFITIPAGRTKATVPVLVKGDSATEADAEEFLLVISNAVHATIAEDRAVGVILDDDSPPKLAIGDVEIGEKNSGLTRALFNVALSHRCSSDVRVRFSTVDGTATAGDDYVATNGVLVIPAWRTNAVITVFVKGDSEIEDNEYFTVRLEAPSNATLARGEGQGIIIDDDGTPQLALEDVTVKEWPGKRTKAVFRAMLSHKIGQPVTAVYATHDGTAQAGADYGAVQGLLTIPPWRSNATVVVEVYGDGEPEPATEYFTLTLSAASNAVITVGEARATIIDADAPPQLFIGDTTVSCGYGDTVRAGFPLTLSRPSLERVSVEYATLDDTAVAGRDYQPAQGRVIIPKGETNGFVTVLVTGDGAGESEVRQFRIVVSNAVNAVIENSVGVGTISMPGLSVAGGKVWEGNNPDNPEALALRRMIELGLRTGGILFLLLPVIIIVLASREPVLKCFNVDLRSPAYTVGTLTYTKIGLTSLFAWLLWGDFCFTIMNAVAPTVLPLKLKALGASNFMMSLILSTLPSILNLTVCPWVSFKSDRYRSRWGRRIPFIVWTMPFLTASLVLLGWSEDIGLWVRRTIPAVQGIAPNTLAITLIAFFLVLFQFFNLFVNSVFWYLFNDVVPAQFLGRFMGLFRIAGTAASALYQWYIFRYAETNMREILTGGALLYFFGFGLTCWRVKEGEYPPITGEETCQRKGLLTDIKIFAKESFSLRFYWYFFLVAGLSRIAYALGMFNVFFQKQMGLTLDQMGKLAAVGSVVGILTTYFTAALVDRWHPLRILTYQKVFTAVMGFHAWMWVLMTLPGDLYFWMSMVGTIIVAFDYVLDDAAGLPAMMRIFPKSRFGQFCSAQAMIRSLATIGAGMVAGLYMDFLKWLCHGSDYAYRWMWTWTWPFNIIACYFLVKAYQEWKQRGGDDHYRPPAPWDPSGFDQVADEVKSNPGNPKLVLIALGIGALCSIINILLVFVFMSEMRQHNLMWSFWWYLKVFVPIKSVLLGLFLWQIWCIKRDCETLERGGMPRYGIPHYGVILVETGTALVSFAVYWLQMTWMIRIELERELIIFGINTLLTTFAHSLVATHILRVMERPLPPLQPSPVSAPAAATTRPDA